MIFISSIRNKEKELDYSKMIICPNCSGYGRISCFFSYTALSIFLIPILKWNRKYFAKSSCCKTIFSLNYNIGKEIRRGNSMDISEEDLEILDRNTKINICENCNNSLDKNFTYCPYCGGRMK